MGEDGHALPVVDVEPRTAGGSTGTRRRESGARLLVRGASAASARPPVPPGPGAPDRRASERGTDVCAGVRGLGGLGGARGRAGDAPSERLVGRGRHSGSGSAAPRGSLRSVRGRAGRRAARKSTWVHNSKRVGVGRGAAQGLAGATVTVTVTSIRASESNLRRRRVFPARVASAGRGRREAAMGRALEERVVCVWRSARALAGFGFARSRGRRDSPREEVVETAEGVAAAPRAGVSFWCARPRDSCDDSLPSHARSRCVCSSDRTHPPGTRAPPPSTGRPAALSHATARPSFSSLRWRALTHAPSPLEVRKGGPPNHPRRPFLSPWRAL